MTIIQYDTVETWHHFEFESFGRAKKGKLVPRQIRNTLLGLAIIMIMRPSSIPVAIPQTRTSPGCLPAMDRDSMEGLAIVCGSSE